ncbi:deacetylase [Hyaloraphidium curvatum]|nr:deacetylase [Hyaloraphidium curvatum]
MPRKTGFIWEERFMWHNTGVATGFLPSNGEYNEPDLHFESPASKRRFRNLVEVTGLFDSLVHVKAREATDKEIQYYHPAEYMAKVKALSDAGFGDAGELAPVGKNSYEIAKLSAGACIAAVDAVLDGVVDNIYALNRPPGHHAEASQGRGFCIFSNVVIAAEHARKVRGLKRVAILDWDVHHGNGTQKAFYNDPGVLFISIHQDRYYPQDCGFVEENGEGAGEGYNINVPLPPGSGHGAYVSTVERIVVPAIRQYQPEIILISSGFDASVMDPLGRQMATSETYREMTKLMLAVADEVCGGKVAMVHEGGYSPVYVPFCGIATLEEMTGIKTDVVDGFYAGMFKACGGQDLQPHQDALIKKIETELVPKVKKP